MNSDSINSRKTKPVLRTVVAIPLFLLVGWPHPRVHAFNFPQFYWRRVHALAFSRSSLLAGAYNACFL
jgi:hypothetical protein